MTTSLQKFSTFKEQQTVGDGNCAYNAFVRALSQAQVLERIEELSRLSGQTPDLKFAAFIEAASKALGVAANWQRLKQAMLKLHQSKPVYFQKRLAPVLRQLSIDLAMSDASHYGRTLEPLSAALYLFIRRAQGRVIARDADDDIFGRHGFIIAKFQQICADMPAAMNNNAIENYQLQKLDELNAWWQGEGYQQFLLAMRKPGVWAGDLELSQLGHYFGLNLYVNKRNKITQFCHNHGQLPLYDERENALFTQQQLHELRSRGMIDPVTQNDKAAQIQTSMDECEQRLKRVPEYEKVRKYILKAPAKIYRDRGINKLKLSKETLAELSARNVITEVKGQPGQYQIGIPTKKEILLRIAEQPGCKLARQMLSQTIIQQPEILLSNPYACHWSSTLDTSIVQSKKPSKWQDSYFKDITAKLEQWNKQSAKKWEQLLNTVDEALEMKTATILKQATVAYHVPGKRDVVVTRQKQIELDEAYAMSLQKLELESKVRFKRR